MLKLCICAVILFQVSSVIEGKSLEIASYARVARNGAQLSNSSSHEVDGSKQDHHHQQQRPEITSANKTEILTLGTATTGRASVPQPVLTDASSVGTGRSGGSAYPFPSFPLVLSPQQRAKSISSYAQQHFYNHAPGPASSAEYHQPRVVYSQVAQDRFAPGEAYASTLYKVKQNKLKAAAGNTPATGPGSVPQSSNINSVSVGSAAPSVSSYNPQPSGNTPATVPGSVPQSSNFNSVSVGSAPSSVSSYNPQPSGLKPVVSSYNPVRAVPSSPPSPVFRPAVFSNPSNAGFNRIVPASSNVDAAAVPPPFSPNADSPPPDGPPSADDDGPPPSYVPPTASDLLKFPPNNNYDATRAENIPGPTAHSSYLPPASGDSPGAAYLGPFNPESQKAVEAVKIAIDANTVPEVPKPYVISPSDDGPPPGYQSGPPPPPLPPSPHDHFTGQYGYDASPEVVLDYDHHHHDHDHFDYHDFIHHHEHHEEPPPPPPEPTTTTAPEAPAEPRVKTYSYYYLGRKLWYVPLFFTLWFCFYVSALIIKSIARHKVQVPNHWQNRRRRALIEEPHSDTLRKVNKLTYFVMNHLTNFEQKYKNEN